MTRETTGIIRSERRTLAQLLFGAFRKPSLFPYTRGHLLAPFFLAQRAHAMRIGSQVINLVSQFLPSKEIQYSAIYDSVNSFFVSRLVARCCELQSRPLSRSRTNVTHREINLGYRVSSASIINLPLHRSIGERMDAKCNTRSRVQY